MVKDLEKLKHEVLVNLILDFGKVLVSSNKLMTSGVDKIEQLKIKNMDNSPVPRLSFAHRFDTKLREMSFEKQNSAKAVLFTMYVSTAGAKTFYHRKT